MQFSGHVAVAHTTPLNLVVLPFGNAWQDFGQIWIHVDLHRCEWEEGEGDRRWISTAPRLYFSCFPILLWVNWVFLVVSLTRDVTVSITPCSGTWEAVWIEVTLACTVKVTYSHLRRAYNISLHQATLWTPQSWCSTAEERVHLLSSPALSTEGTLQHWSAAK